MKTNFFKTFTIFFAIFIFCETNFFAQTANTNETVSENENPIIEIDKTNLPVLETLSSRNALFQQFTEDVEFNYKQKVRNREQNRQFYLYTLQKNDTLMRVASRTVIAYETLASLNGIANIDDLHEGSTIVIPNFQGIFVADAPTSSIEMLVAKKYENEADRKSVV